MTRFILASLTLTLALPAFAGDGRLEISQTCAVNTGCFSGDAAGYPVTIDGSAGSSYVLTGDLSVSNANLDCIEVTTDGGVTIDLNGFKLMGPVVCTGQGSGVTCGPGTGRGITAFTQLNVSVHSGFVTGFGSDGMFLGNRSLVERVMAHGNGASGIQIGATSIVRLSIARNNFGFGIIASIASVVEHCTAGWNRSGGILAFSGSAVLGSTVSGNGGRGIDVSQYRSIVRGNSISQNQDDGILAGDGSLIIDNVVVGNGGDGVDASISGTSSGSTVQRNSVRSNTGFGLNLGADATYRENSITANTAGPIAGTGTNRGDNYCAGTGTILDTCP